MASMQSRTNLKQLRERRGLSQTALAEKMGTTLNFYGKLERGTRRLNMDWLARIAAALEVGMDEIVADIEDGSTSDDALPVPTIEALREMVAEHYKGVTGSVIDPEMLHDLSERILRSVENWKDEPIAARDPQVARSVARQINLRYDH